MDSYKTQILANICYTELVYGRINKKLKCELSKTEIEAKLLAIIKETKDVDFQKRGKNVYVESVEENIRITVNMNTYRIITVDVLSKKKNL